MVQHSEPHEIRAEQKHVVRVSFKWESEEERVAQFKSERSARRQLGEIVDASDGVEQKRRV